MIEVLKQMVEALEWCHGGEPIGTAEAIEVGKQAIAELESQSTEENSIIENVPAIGGLQRTGPAALSCCGYTDASAVKWNPLNGVVQCHNCGQNYTPSQRTEQEPVTSSLVECVMSARKEFSAIKGESQFCTECHAFERADSWWQEWHGGDIDYITGAVYTHPTQRTEPQIKTTDSFESARVGDYNRGWNDCLFASGIVKQSQHTWVGLTTEERNDCLVSADPCEALAEPEAEQLMEDIEAKLKQKNGFAEKNT
jgi:hypothetical protein